jgi:prepilin-type N-terminal cleavage/methylation domain-containing protein
MAKAKRAFTLIELLVVVAIIALLIAILLPGLGQAKRLAIRVQCATNLRGWGQALYLYSTENSNWVLRSGGLGAPTQMEGDNWHAAIGPFGGNTERWGDINVQKMARYLPGVSNPDSPNWGPIASSANGPLYVGEPWDFTFSKIWLCPASTNTNHPQGGPFYVRNMWPWAVWYPYCYYGRVSEWSRTNYGSPPINYSGAVPTYPNDILDTQYLSGRVMLSDSTYSFGGATGWHFNHSTSGYGYPEFNDQSNGYDVNGTSSPQSMQGSNIGYGDGRVEWRVEPAATLTASLATGGPTTDKYHTVWWSGVPIWYGGQP